MYNKHKIINWNVRNFYQSIGPMVSFFLSKFVIFFLSGQTTTYALFIYLCLNFILIENWTFDFFLYKVKYFNFSHASHFLLNICWPWAYWHKNANFMIIIIKIKVCQENTIMSEKIKLKVFMVEIKWE